MSCFGIRRTGQRAEPLRAPRRLVPRFPFSMRSEPRPEPGQPLSRCRGALAGGPPRWRQACPLHLAVTYVCPARPQHKRLEPLGPRDAWSTAVSTRGGGPAGSGPCQTPMGKYKGPQAEGQRLAGPLMGSGPRQHLLSALSPQLRSTLASGSLRKPQPVLKKLPTSSRCPITSCTCGARWLSSEETWMRLDGGMRRPCPSALPM